LQIFFFFYFNKFFIFISQASNLLHIEKVFHAQTFSLQRNQSCRDDNAEVDADACTGLLRLSFVDFAAIACCKYEKKYNILRLLSIKKQFILYIFSICIDYSFHFLQLLALENTYHYTHSLSPTYSLPSLPPIPDHNFFRLFTTPTFTHVKAYIVRECKICNKKKKVLLSSFCFA
jgi:hypothetical protein